MGQELQAYTCLSTFFVLMSQSWYWTNLLLNALCCCSSAVLRRNVVQPLVIALFYLAQITAVVS